MLELQRPRDLHLVQHLRLGHSTQRNVLQAGQGRQVVRLLQLPLFTKLDQPRRSKKETQVRAKHAIRPKGLPLKLG